MSRESDWFRFGHKLGIEDRRRLREGDDVADIANVSLYKDVPEDVREDVRAKVVHGYLEGRNHHD